MIYLTTIVFILVLLINLLFYIPLIIHIYVDKDILSIYLFAIPIFVISDNKTINLLKNKISIDQLLNASKIDLKMIEAIKIDEIKVSINYEFANQYAQYIYPLVALNNIYKINFKINDKTSLYIKTKITLVNILLELITIRRMKKNERKSYKWNIKNIIRKY